MLFLKRNESAPRNDGMVSSRNDGMVMPDESANLSKQHSVSYHTNKFRCGTHRRRSLCSLSDFLSK